MKVEIKQVLNNGWRQPAIDAAAGVVGGRRRYRLVTDPLPCTQPPVKGTVPPLPPRIAFVLWLTAAGRRRRGLDIELVAGRWSSSSRAPSPPKPRFSARSAGRASKRTLRWDHNNNNNARAEEKEVSNDPALRTVAQHQHARYELYNAQGLALGLPSTNKRRWEEKEIVERDAGE